MSNHYEKEKSLQIWTQSLEGSQVHNEASQDKEIW
jgi:hypothetical protein